MKTKITMCLLSGLFGLTLPALGNVISLDPGQYLNVGGDTIVCRRSATPGGDCQPQVLCGECRETSSGGKRSCTVIPCQGDLQHFDQDCTPEPAYYRCDDCVRIQGQAWGYVVFRNGSYHDKVVIGSMDNCLQRRLADWRCNP